MRGPHPRQWRRGAVLWTVVVVLAAAGVAALALHSASTAVPPSPASGGRPGSSGSSDRPAGTATTSPAPGVTGTTTTAWTVYHGTPAGAGTTTASVDLRHPRRAWTSTTLDGQVYGEPLVAGGRVVVATENDTVYALAAASGTVLWSTHVGTPVPAAHLPCGDITPDVGITGTPVIDTARNEVFAVADELVTGTPSHHLLGLDLGTGAVRIDVPVDPPGADTAALLQRTGLALDRGSVVFGFGGNFGDCSRYHGWIESVPEGGGTVSRFEVDAAPGEAQGAVWMGGAAPEVDAAGNIWVAVGNGSVTAPGAPFDGSDAVLQLSPALTRTQYFAPSSWRSDNAGDEDLGSTAPALLADGTVFQVGKSETGYLLSAARLGGIGGELRSAHVCTGDAAGGDAVRGTTVYVGCRSGLEAVQTSVAPPSVTVRWTADRAATGPPIVAGGLVWSIGGGTLYGIDPSTGSTAVRLDVGSQADHFPSPAVGDGLLLAPGGTRGDRVLAFAGSAGLAAAPSTTTSA